MLYVHFALRKITILLPTMVHLDGFHLSHVIEPIMMPEQSQVDAFLPPNKYPFFLDPARPQAMGDFAPPLSIQRPNGHRK